MCVCVRVRVRVCVCVRVCAGTFEDEDVTHVEGDVNPVRDLEIISDELRLKDIEYLQKAIVRERERAKIFELYSSMFSVRGQFQTDIGYEWVR